MVLKSRYRPVPSNTIAVSTESTKNLMEKYTFLEKYAYDSFSIQMGTTL